MATLVAKASSRQRSGSGYYTALTALMLVLGLIAFSDNLVTDVGQESNRQLSMIVHSLFAAGWMICLVIQANFVRSGSLDKHRKIGPYVFAIGAGLVLSTSYLFYAGFAGFSEMSPPVMVNRIVLPIFAVAIFVAWRRRHLAAVHKRLIVLGTVLTLQPILSRALDIILNLIVPGRNGGVDPLFVATLAAVWTAILVSHWIYDRKTNGRVHPLTIGATVTLYAVYAFAYSI